MPSKGKPKGAGAPSAATAVAVAVAEHPLPLDANPVSTEPPVLPPVGDPAGTPIHTEPLNHPLAEDATPEQVFAMLNALALNGTLSKKEYADFYLKLASFLGLPATTAAADQHWDTLHAEQARESAEARDLAAARQQQALAGANITPWNPLADPAASAQIIDQQRVAFKEATWAFLDTVDLAGGTDDTAGHLKNHIAHDLGQASGLGYDKANAFLLAWAQSSSDTDTRSVAMQVATAEKFGTELTPFIANKDKLFKATVATYAKNREDARAFIDAMYERTQKWFASRDITELYLFRGMHKTGASAGLDELHTSGKPTEVTVHHNPLNSWTIDLSIAESGWFSGKTGYMVTARVPVSNIVGCCLTGLGCYGEKEFVVLGGPDINVTAAANSEVSYASVKGGA